MNFLWGSHRSNTWLYLIYTNYWHENQYVESRFSRVHDPWWKSQDFQIQEFIFTLSVVVPSACRGAVGPHNLHKTALPMESGFWDPGILPEKRRIFLSDLIFGFRRIWGVPSFQIRNKDHLRWASVPKVRSVRLPEWRIPGTKVSWDVRQEDREFEHRWS